MVPSFTANLGLRYDLSATVFELNGGWVGSQFLVGDEGNEATLGKLDGYVLLDLSAERSFGNAALYLRVTNLLDTDYQAYGVLSENLRGPTGGVERFLTPGQPAALSAGIKIHLQP